MSETKTKAARLWASLEAAAFAVASAESGYTGHVSVYDVPVDVVQEVARLAGEVAREDLNAHSGLVNVQVRVEVSGVPVYVDGKRPPVAADFEAAARKAAAAAPSWLGRTS